DEQADQHRALDDPCVDDGDGAAPGEQRREQEALAAGGARSRRRRRRRLGAGLAARHALRELGYGTVPSMSSVVGASWGRTLAPASLNPVTTDPNPSSRPVPRPSYSRQRARESE